MSTLELKEQINTNNWFSNALKSNSLFLLQTTPFLIGYSIFLCYFIQNNFFPNIVHKIDYPG
jgi:hypothetical protein